MKSILFWILAIVGLCSILGVSFSGLLRKSADVVDQGQNVVHVVTENAQKGIQETKATVEKAKKIKHHVDAIDQ